MKDINGNIITEEEFTKGESTRPELPMKTTPQEEWEDGFSELWGIDTEGTFWNDPNCSAESIKSFIKSEKEKSYLLGVGKEAMRNQDRYYRQGRQEVLREVREKIQEYRDDLQFVWRWIDRCHGGKEHDKPEENWKNYIGVLVAYPNSPHETGDWFEEEDPFLSTLESKE